jgi:hypothetical protein
VSFTKIPSYPSYRGPLGPPQGSEAFKIKFGESLARQAAQRPRHGRGLEVGARPRPPRRARSPTGEGGQRRRWGAGRGARLGRGPGCARAQPLGLLCSGALAARLRQLRSPRPAVPARLRYTVTHSTPPGPLQQSSSTPHTPAPGRPLPLRAGPPHTSPPPSRSRKSTDCTDLPAASGAERTKGQSFPARAATTTVAAAAAAAAGGVHLPERPTQQSSTRRAPRPGRGGDGAGGRKRQRRPRRQQQQQQ